MWDGASPQDVVTFLQRIDATVTTGRNTRDAWIEFLKKNGGGSGSINDMEDSWLNTRMGTTKGKGKDKIDNYLSSKGFTGSPNDKIRAYFKGSTTQ